MRIPAGLLRSPYRVKLSYWTYITVDCS